MLQQNRKRDTSACIFHYHEDLIIRVNHFIETYWRITNSSKLLIQLSWQSLHTITALFAKNIWWQNWYNVGHPCRYDSQGAWTKFSINSCAVYRQRLMCYKKKQKWCRLITTTITIIIIIWNNNFNWHLRQTSVTIVLAMTSNHKNNTDFNKLDNYLSVWD